MQEQSSKLSEQGKGFQDNYPPVYNSFTDYVNSQMSTIGRARSWQDQKSLFGMRINPKKLPGERKVNPEQTSFSGDLKEFINDMQLGLGGDGNNGSSTYCPFHGYNCYCIFRPQSRIGFQGNVTQMSDANMGPQTPDQTLRSPGKQETNQDEREVQAIMIGQPPKGDFSRIRPIHTARQQVQPMQLQVQSRATAQAQSTPVRYMGREEHTES
ncbi:unnamed protein product, partial [Ilex paraguariensis]